MQDDGDAIFSGARRKLELALQGSLRKLRASLKNPSNNCAPGEEMQFSDPRLGPARLLGWLQAKQPREKVHHGQQLLAAAKALVRTVDEGRALRALLAAPGDDDDCDAFSSSSDDDDGGDGDGGGGSAEERERRVGLKAVRLIRVLFCIRSKHGRFLGLPLAAVAVSKGLSITGGLNAVSLFVSSPQSSALYTSYKVVTGGYIGKLQIDIHMSPYAHIIGCDNFNIQPPGLRQGASDGLHPANRWRRVIFFSPAV